MDTINISANTRRLQICASRDPSRSNMSAVFYRKGYAFATDGHMAVIRRTDADEPQDVAVNLPIPGARVRDMHVTLELDANNLNQVILVATNGSTTLGLLMPVKGESIPSEVLGNILAVL